MMFVILSQRKKIVVDVFVNGQPFGKCCRRCVTTELLFSHEKIIHGLLLYYFLITIDNVLGSYRVTNIGKKFTEMP